MVWGIFICKPGTKELDIAFVNKLADCLLYKSFFDLYWVRHWSSGPPLSITEEALKEAIDVHIEAMFGWVKRELNASSMVQGRRALLLIITSFFCWTLKREFELVVENGFEIIEWIVDVDNINLNPLLALRGVKNALWLVPQALQYQGMLWLFHE